MKVVEAWKSKEGYRKLIVKRWWGKTCAYYWELGYWKTERGTRVNSSLSRKLDGLVWIVEIKDKTQLHKIVFDQLTQNTP